MPDGFEWSEVRIRSSLPDRWGMTAWHSRLAPRHPQIAVLAGGWVPQLPPSSCLWLHIPKNDALRESGRGADKCKDMLMCSCGDISQGSRVEIHQKQKWWEGEVVENAGDRVKLRYKDQPNKDEWLDKSSARLRPHQDDAGGNSGQQGGQNGEGTESPHGGGEGESSRPMRKSRLISDDAKVMITNQK